MDVKICAYNLPRWISARIQSAFRDAKLSDEKLTISSAEPGCEVAVVTITSAVGKETLSSMPRLRAIITASTGTDHIDMEECARRGISVRNCPSYSSNGVAELAVALAFTGLRGMERMLGFGRSLAYPPTVFHHIGSELSGKTCAVLGTGQIGALIALKLAALGCRVIAFSRSQNPGLLRAGIEYCTIEEAAARADLVFIALPSTPQTRHMIDGDLLARMRTGAGIVNIARGEIVDSQALLHHIDRLGFYASDVVEGEAALWLGRPMKVGAVNELVLKPNFYLVPHIGASTSQAQERLAEEVVQGVKEFYSP